MRRRQPEKAVQVQIVRTLQLIGAAVYVSGTTRPRGDHQGTCMTPGIPDIEAFLPAQAEYRAHCLAAGVAHIVGGLDDVLQWLLAEGYVREQQIPYYRGSALPAAQTEA